MHNNIAVIIPVFNRAHAIGESLDSVAAQTLAPALVVVVDDGSTDGSAAAAETWVQKTKPPFPVRVVKQENAGASVARNRGAAEASNCRWLAFLDSDDLFDPDYLAFASGVIDRGPDVVAVIADWWDIDMLNNTRSYADVRPITFNTTLRYFNDMQPLARMAGSLICADAFHRVGGFDPRFRKGQDKLFMLRLSMQGRFVHAPGAAYLYRRYLGETSGEAAGLHNMPDRLLNSVRLAEVFLFEFQGERALAESVWRRRLSYLCYRAARHLIKTGRASHAKEYLDRALKYQPYHLSARWCRILIG